MFEKCGLRDIIVRIWKLKWLVLVLVIIGAAAGSLMYIRDVQAYNAEKAQESTYYHSMYAGHAYYYINVSVSGSDMYAKRQSAVADSYKKLFALPSRSRKIYSGLLENHSAEELRTLLDAERYAENNVPKYKLYGKAYGIRTISNKAVLELRVCAETREMCSELLKICRAELKDIDNTMLNSTLVYESRYIKKTKINERFFNGIYVVKTDETSDSSSEQTETVSDEPDETETAAPGIKPIILWAVIGLLAGIVFAIAAAVFAPTINRDSDFEGYGIPSLGTVRKDGAAILARILKKKAEDRGVGRLAIVTTLKPDRTTAAFAEEIKKAAAALGLDLIFIEQPAKKAEAAEALESVEIMIAAEKKGISRHQRFDEMKHYLELMDKSLDGAVLLA